MRFLCLILIAALLGCTADNASKVEQSIEFKVLSKGEAIDLEPHIVKGSVTVFDFYADWCPPCKKLDRSLVDMKKIYGDRLTIHKLDVVEWGSELVNQYDIKSLPHLRVYDEQGKLLKDGSSNEVLPLLMDKLNSN